MGFPRAQVVSALAAAIGNADRAVEYLTGGILPAPAPPPSQAPAQLPAASSGFTFTADSVTQALQAAPAAAPTLIERMRREPQLLQLCAMARQNPALLHPLLEEMNRSSPNIMQLIQQARVRPWALGLRLCHKWRSPGRRAPIRGAGKGNSRKGRFTGGLRGCLRTARFSAIAGPDRLSTPA